MHACIHIKLLSPQNKQKMNMKTTPLLVVVREKEEKEKGGTGEQMES